MKKYVLAIGSDHAGYTLKHNLIKRLEAKGHTLIDCGNMGDDDAMYAYGARNVAQKIRDKEADYGILICGTGQGMAMMANQFKGIRAAIAYDIFPAVLSKEHNNSNILCTGAWMVDINLLERMIDAWLLVSYNGHYDEGLELIEKYKGESC